MQTLIATIICFLMVYGAVAMVEKLVDKKKKKLRSLKSSHIVLSVKNREDTIEGIVRGIIWESFPGDIIVLDEGSADDTPEILRRLEREIPSLTYMKKEDYISYISNNNDE